MPIRPEHRGFDPIDWPRLSDVIRFRRAGGRCEGCGRPHLQRVAFRAGAGSTPRPRRGATGAAGSCAAACSRRTCSIRCALPARFSRRRTSTATLRMMPARLRSHPFLRVMLRRGAGGEENASTRTPGGTSRCPGGRERGRHPRRRRMALRFFRYQRLSSGSRLCGGAPESRATTRGPRPEAGPQARRCAPSRAAIPVGSTVSSIGRTGRRPRSNAARRASALAGSATRRRVTAMQADAAHVAA